MKSVKPFSQVWVSWTLWGQLQEEERQQRRPAKLCYSLLKKAGEAQRALPGNNIQPQIFSSTVTSMLMQFQSSGSSRNPKASRRDAWEHHLVCLSLEMPLPLLFWSVSWKEVTLPHSLADTHSEDHARILETQFWKGHESFSRAHNPGWSSRGGSETNESDMQDEPTFTFCLCLSAYPDFSSNF